MWAAWTAGRKEASLSHTRAGPPKPALSPELVPGAALLELFQESGVRLKSRKEMPFPKAWMIWGIVGPSLIQPGPFLNKVGDERDAPTHWAEGPFLSTSAMPGQPQTLPFTGLGLGGWPREATGHLSQD